MPIVVTLLPITTVRQWSLSCWHSFFAVLSLSFSIWHPLQATTHSVGPHLLTPCCILFHGPLFEFFYMTPPPSYHPPPDHICQYRAADTKSVFLHGPLSEFFYMTPLPAYHPLWLTTFVDTVLPMASIRPVLVWLFFVLLFYGLDFWRVHLVLG